MHCPKCNNDQSIEFSYATGTYNCPACTGCWMEYSPIKKYLEERDTTAAEALRSIWDLRAEKSPNLRCPQDNEALYVFLPTRAWNWSFASNVEGFGLMPTTGGFQTTKPFGTAENKNKKGLRCRLDGSKNIHAPFFRFFLGPEGRRKCFQTIKPYYSSPLSSH